jgi:SsrA-binding protein
MSKTYAENRRARFDYEILETFEAGIELKGHEAKAVKSGQATIAGTFAVIRGGEAYLLNATIQPYQALNTPKEYDPTRTRKLLLNKKEIKYLIGKSQTERLTIVPLKLYNKSGLIKVELGLVRSKKKADKREKIKKRDTRREIERTLKKEW